MNRRRFIKLSAIGAAALALPVKAIAFSRSIGTRAARTPTTADDPLTARDLRILNLQTPLTLALWWGELNGWKWPPELNPAEPVPARIVSPFRLAAPRRNAIMDWIAGRVTHKFLLRVHNSNLTAGRNQKSDGEFEAWWNAHERRGGPLWKTTVPEIRL